MQDKDITEKILEDYPEIFADIVNVLLFHGAEVIKPEELEDMRLRSAYRAENGLHDMEREVAKRGRNNGIRIACIGFENQSRPEADMVLRVYGYDGAEYRTQCLKENRGKPRYPVVTLVLYFGEETRWNQPKTLYEAVDVPDIFKPFVSDVKMNVFDITWLTEEQVKLFKSDFRIVADYFVQKRMTGKYRGSLEEVKHMQEVLQLLKAVEHDDRFYEEGLLEAVARGEVTNMCKVLDEIENRGMAKGAAQKEREINERVATDMLKKQYPLEAIKDISKLPENVIRSLAKTLGVAVL